MRRLICMLTVVMGLCRSLAAAEYLWLEAEHFDGIRGYCWPMGRPEMKVTDGNWGLSGPGWAAEWNQGGESGFLSIATAADDDRAVVTRTVEVPAEGHYTVWVRYGDWREQTERFQLRIEQPGAEAQELRFGEAAIVEEDNEMKLYFGWAFAWDGRPVALNKGECRLSLVSTSQEPQPRQVDVIVITDEAEYRPLIKERPADPAWETLDAWREGGVPDELEPLARAVSQRADGSGLQADVPPEWGVRTFRDKGFLYLWNTGHTDAGQTWLSDRPDRVKFPYNIIDVEVRKEFEQTYGGRDDVPIYSDPRIVPTFHGVGPGIFATDPATGEVNETGRRFAAWLDAHPDRAWAMMMNYHAGAPIGEQGQALFTRYRDRYVGSISGESLGYFYPQPDAMQAATAAAATRRELVAAFSPVTLAENAAKYRAVFGRDVDANPYEDVISCMSVGNIAFTPLCFDWGARIGGYESSAATASVLPMRMAFMRGLSRQHGRMFGTYRSCNFGDSSTIFSNGGSYHTPQAIFDNYYSVFSGAGMTWYKFDIWQQYMAGSAFFYHEQGFDEFWKPGGLTAAGIKPVQLSPKGKLVDRFLRVTAANSDRGTPYTPVAFLVDYAHGWEPAPFWPNSFKNWHQNEEKFRFGPHEKMLEQYFWTAYHPIGPESEKPMTGTNEVYVPGVFGDMFDVIAAYPDVNKWQTIDSYPVVIVAGEIELTEAEGERLAQYMQRGGTLLVADAHLTGPGLARLQLPATSEPGEGTSYAWHLQGELQGALDPLAAPGRNRETPAFRFRPIDIADGRAIAETEAGVFCAAFDRGEGRLVYLSVPHGLTISQQAHPVLPQLFAHLTRGLMPVQVTGDVEWMLNRTADGWLVTLLNPAGQEKPQHGITPTDYRENRVVRLKWTVPVTSARDRLQPDEPFAIEEQELQCVVPAGGVRVLELR